MAFKVSGLLQQVFVEEGQRLKKGDLLAQIDSRDYELLFQAVESEYLGIKSEAERVIDLYADSVATTSEYDKARYGLNQIKAKYENAKNQLADTKIYAPFDGVVKTTFFNSPTVVGAGMPILSLLSSEMPEAEKLGKAIHFCTEIDKKKGVTGFEDGATCQEFSDYLMAELTK